MTGCLPFSLTFSSHITSAPDYMLHAFVYARTCGICMLCACCLRMCEGLCVCVCCIGIRQVEIDELMEKIRLLNTYLHEHGDEAIASQQELQEKINTCSLL